MRIETASSTASSSSVQRLASAGAVVIEGAKASGRTETARRVAASEVFLDVAARQALDIDPDLVLKGYRSRLIDEWQAAPQQPTMERDAAAVHVEPGDAVAGGLVEQHHLRATDDGDEVEDDQPSRHGPRDADRPLISKRPLNGALLLQTEKVYLFG